MKIIKKLKNVSIFRHYYFILSCLVVFCLLTASLSLLFFLSTFWVDEKLDNLHKISFVLSADMQKYQTVEEALLDPYFANSLNAISDMSSADLFIIDKNGNIVLCKDMVRRNYLNDEPVLQKCSLHSRFQFDQETLNNIFNEKVDYRQKGPISQGAEETYLLSSLKCDARFDGYYIVAVQLLRVGYIPYVTNYIRMVLCSCLIAVILTFFAALGATYRILRPLKKISEAVKHYAAGDFGYRIYNVGHYREFHELSVAFNKMAAAMEENESSRRNFVANVSHELKTPMTTISGFIDGILDGTIPPHEERKYLKIVSEVVKHLSELVVSMLNISKIEAGKVELEYTELLFNDLVISTVLNFEKQITDKNIEIYGLDKFDKIYLRADEALLRQIVFNLVDNAVKFTHEGGTVKFELYEDKSQAVLSIANSGSEIAPEELSNIFDRFYKIDKSRGLDSSGFGLGLYIVRSIVEMHGGTIKVSCKDGYTKFVVKMPL